MYITIICFTLFIRLTNTDFEILATEILKVFPTETKDIYYVPPIRKRNSAIKKHIISKGKLIDKYRNRTREYRVSGLALFDDDDDIRKQERYPQTEGTF